MADLSQLSDADLQAIASGDMSKVSDDALNMLSGGGGAPKQPPGALAETPSDLMRERGGFTPAGSAVKKRAEMAGGATAARLGSAVLSGTGGPTGAIVSGTGEGIAQLMEGEGDPRALAQATALGGLPLGRLAGIKNSVGRGLSMAGATAGTNYGVNKAADATVGNDGTNAAKQAGVIAAITAAMPMLGKVIGKLTNNVSPEEMARIQDVILNNKNADKTLAGMKAHGNVAVVPSSVNPSIKNQILESIAGIQNVEAGVARENAPLFNKIGRKEASLGPTTEINPDTAKAARQEIADGSYDVARQAGFGQELNNWREAQTLLKTAQTQLKGGFTNARGKAVDDAELAMKAAEEAMTEAAGGDPSKLAIIQEARVKFGKNYDVEESVAGGTDNVQAAILSEMLRQRGEGGLTGGLQDIAKFHNAFSRSSKNPAKMATAPGAASAGAAMVAGGGNPVNTAGLTGGTYLLRKGVRDVLVSPAYQAKNAQRNYKPATSSDPEMEALMARIAALVEANRQ
jgi:hypothetical protein